MQAEATTRDGPDGDRAPWMKLTEAATRLRVPVTGAHNALADVRTALARRARPGGRQPRMTVPPGPLGVPALDVGRVDRAGGRRPRGRPTATPR